ncbi:hypothetical protein WJX73_000827 [Symbiochloris irregularis]|uniref:Uncharacterized protein n=1 Tax=Symbiochloris irregularis TaxID=706552 RepID=A0AAW1NP72_9CHLO
MPPISSTSFSPLCASGHHKSFRPSRQVPGAKKALSCKLNKDTRQPRTPLSPGTFSFSAFVRGRPRSKGDPQIVSRQLSSAPRLGPCAAMSPTVRAILGSPEDQQKQREQDARLKVLAATCDLMDILMAGTLCGVALKYFSPSGALIRILTTAAMAAACSRSYPIASDT